MAKFKIGISRDSITADGGTIFGEEAFEVLKDPAVEWEFMPEKVGEIPPEYAARYDAICLMSAKVTRKTFSGADKKLKLVARFGVGYDSVDVPACTDNGALLTIKNLHGTAGVTRLIPAFLAAAAAACTYLIALQRQRTLQQRPMPARITPRRQVYIVGIAVLVLIAVTAVAELL